MERASCAGFRDGVSLFLAQQAAMRQPTHWPASVLSLLICRAALWARPHRPNAQRGSHRWRSNCAHAVRPCRSRVTGSCATSGTLPTGGSRWPQ